MKLCDGCGSPKAAIGMGSAILCRTCAEDVRPEMDRLRAEGRPVNVLQIARKMFRETHSGGNYLLRDLPQDLWARAKHRAVDEGISLRDLLLKALHSYLD